MSARILEGTALAGILRAEAAEGAEAFRKSSGRSPGLRVILVGEDAGSQVYVRSKEKAAIAAGLRAETLRLPASISEAELLSRVADANRTDEVDGLLLQMPLPSSINTRRLLDAIHPAKDVDGFHPVNAGLLHQGRPRFVPCTPAGILELLRRGGERIEGRPAVIVGRSEIVGKPMAALLLQENATVTIAHSKTADLPAVCRTAEILVVAIGRPRFVTREFVRPGAVVIDVGINRLSTGLCGDVDFDSVRETASAVTPVPGGVGPLTVAMLLKNTVKAAVLRQSERTGAGSPGC
ncbi:MAG: bifunctional 5,10-methylenetetrahydrofolate dehydrogenase/5,10-methenyltetrahydrofolate cyclohydrolase [Thermoanaerobaculia bacterium]